MRAGRPDFDFVEDRVRALLHLLRGRRISSVSNTSTSVRVRAGITHHLRLQLEGLRGSVYVQVQIAVVVAVVAELSGYT